MRRCLQRAHLAAVPHVQSASGTAPAALTYTMDPGHTEVVARWNHFGFSTPAAIFCQVDGTITYDAGHPERSSVQVTIPVASLRTTMPMQDGHLKSAEFFDAGKFPDIRFKSTRVERGTASGKLKVTGDLVVHGITKPVVLDVTINHVGGHAMHDNVPAAGFDAIAHLNRADFGMGAHVPMVSDRIDLRITAEAIESKAWAAITAKSR